MVIFQSERRTSKIDVNVYRRSLPRPVSPSQAKYIRGPKSIVGTQCTFLIFVCSFSCQSLFYQQSTRHTHDIVTTQSLDTLMTSAPLPPLNQADGNERVYKDVELYERENTASRYVVMFLINPPRSAFPYTSSSHSSTPRYLGNGLWDCGDIHRVTGICASGFFIVEEMHVEG